MSRPRCAACGRALGGGCICRWVRPTANEIELLVLQHPLEQHEHKNSAALLRLGLARCRVLVGERFDELMPGALDGAALLYPGEGTAEPAAVRRLLVLDATWRKSRKLLHLNPRLAALPRVALGGALPASRYAPLRRAREAGQLSTLEAAALALGRLEGAPGRYEPLLEGFDGFVAQLQSGT